MSLETVFLLLGFALLGAILVAAACSPHDPTTCNSVAGCTASRHA